MTALWACFLLVKLWAGPRVSEVFTALPLVTLLVLAGFLASSGKEEAAFQGLVSPLHSPVLHFPALALSFNKCGVRENQV